MTRRQPQARTQQGRAEEHEKVRIEQTEYTDLGVDVLQPPHDNTAERVVLLRSLIEGLRAADGAVEHLLVL